MSATRSPAQQTAARANGARSRGPTTDAGKARSSRNGTRPGLRGGPFALLTGEGREEFAELHAAVTADWGPRDACERRWVMDLVTSLWRQDWLRRLELATLTTATEESPPSDATVRKLTTFARYGARIDKDIGRALQALRVLRNRPGAWVDELRHDTSEPGKSEPSEQDCSHEAPPRTREPEAQEPHEARCANDLAACTREPEPPPTPSASESAPALNRHQRRRLDALARRALSWSA